MRLHRRSTFYSDFHGVVVDPQKLKEDIVWQEFGKRISGALLKREIAIPMGLLTEEEYYRLAYLINESAMLLQAKPIPGANKYIRKLLKAGCEVVIVTASSKRAFKTVMRWLKKNRFPLHHPNFRVVATGWKSNKAIAMGLADVILEDDFEHLRNAYALAQERLRDKTRTIHRKGHLVLLDRPYNRDVDVEEIAAVRKPNWKEVYAHIRMLLWDRKRSKRRPRHRPHQAT